MSGEKYLSALLAALTLAGVLASCSEVGNAPAGTTASGGSEAETTTAETTTAEILPEIPDKKYDGYTFTFLGRGKECNEWEAYDIVSEGENGDLINDAVFRRNTAVEDKLGIKIARKTNGWDVNGAAKSAILAGDDIYDVVMPGIGDTGTLAIAGYLTDVAKLKYIDLEKPWYDHNAAADLSIGHRLYYVISDITVIPLDSLWVTMFNKDMITDFKLDDPYKLVIDSTWTFDRLLSHCAAVTRDINGDSKMALEDAYGFGSHDYTIKALYFGAGERISGKDENDFPKLTMNTPKVSTIIEKTIQLQKYWHYSPLTAKSYGAPEYPYGDGWVNFTTMFGDGRVLFLGEVLQVAQRVRQIETNFGMIPTPKYDEKQDRYYTAVNQVATTIAVPVTAKDPDRTSAVIEYMSYASHGTLIPAYYDIALKDKYLRDEMSAEVLDLMIDTRFYDLADLNKWGDLSNLYLAMVYKGEKNFASLYSANEPAALAQMNEMIAKFKELK